MWKWAEAACNAGGLGFSGWVKPADGSGPTVAVWERACNANIPGVELAGSAADYPRQWNRCTGNWLRYYVYERLAPPGKRSVVPPFVALLVTQLLSGLWHGLFAGYFLFFATSIFMLQAAKEVFRIQARWALISLPHPFTWASHAAQITREPALVCGACDPMRPTPVRSTVAHVTSALPPLIDLSAEDPPGWPSDDHRQGVPHRRVGLPPRLRGECARSSKLQPASAAVV